MYEIPNGFIDIATSEVRKAFFRDRNNGEYHPAEHYYILGANSIWSGFINWKNKDASMSGRATLTVRDIECGCKRFGIPCSYDGDDLLLSTNNMKYIFIPSWNFCYGGPIGNEKHNFRYILERTQMHFSIGAMFRVLERFDNAIPVFRSPIEDLVDILGRQYKRAQILQAGAEQILEPGLEDVAYRYSFRSDEEDRLDIWIYYGLHNNFLFGNVIKLSFLYEEYSSNPQFIKNIVKRLAQDRDKISSYETWATDILKKDEEYPKYSKIKNAGVFAMYTA